jgi:hypothetical protein
MGKLAVMEFVSVDGVFEVPAASRATSTAAGRSSTTGERTATSSSSTR